MRRTISRSGVSRSGFSMDVLRRVMSLSDRCAFAGYQPVLLSGSNQVIEPCLDAALLVRNLRECKTHLHAAQCAGQHEIVEIAQMANAENFSLQPSQAVPERHIELIEDHLA